MSDPRPTITGGGAKAEPRGGAALGALAAAWGFAEATLFFVVPDVLLTWVALERSPPLRAMVLALLATAGALAGGAVMYAWSARDPASARAAVAMVPAVSEGLIDLARDQFAAGGTRALIAAGVSGSPYKVFALHAPALGVGLPAFLLGSVPARLGRFALAAGVSWAIRRWVFGRASDRTARWILAGFWVVLYAAYWSAMGW